MAAPVTMVLLLFPVIPIILIATVSFWSPTGFSTIPAVVFENYELRLASSIIRMIFWPPFQGHKRIGNSTLVSWDRIGEPLKWLLFSCFSVVLAFLYLNLLFLVTPIFNTLVRMDKSLIEAARDVGRTGFSGFVDCYHRAGKTGDHDRDDLRSGLLMGDVFTVRIMSGRQSATVRRLISNGTGLLQHASASATATILLVIGIFPCFVDVRKEI